MTIRNILSKDKDHVKQLVFGLYEEDDLGADMTDEIFERNYDQALKGDDVMRMVVFEIDGDAAGYSMLMKQWCGETGGWILQIDELYVSKQYRGHGCATRFFAWLDDEYDDVSMFYLETSKGNENARRLYRRMGFEESSLKGMCRHIDGYMEHAS